MSKSIIPEKVYDYNAYDDNQQLIGIASEITLPNLELMSETISGAGIMGEYESTTAGHFSSLEFEIQFRTLFQQSFGLLEYSGRPLILRAIQQSTNRESRKVEYRPLKITVIYQPKGLNLGKLGKGVATETSNALEATYLKIEENGVVLLEVDKLNYIYVLNGVDQLKGIRDFL